VLIEDLVSAGMEFYEQYNAEVVRQLGDDLEPLIRDTMSASMAGTYYATAIGMAMLARSWQAGLYNPGGFRKEFHSLRLSPAIAVLCAVTMVLGPVLGLNSLLLAWAAGTPLFIAGLGLVHGVVSRKQWSGQWVVMFYIALVLLGPSLMMLLLVMAFVDSWLDIRGRITSDGSAE
jgi:hypothetical protein